ncbi:helix-turn-helix domain-containing protein [Methylobacterium mesophilicum]
MRTVFSTEGLHPRDSFRRWRENLFDRGMPIEQQPLSDAPFEAKMKATRIGPLVMTSLSQSALRSEITPTSIRRYADHQHVDVIFKISGVSKRIVDDQDTVQRPGDFVVYDRRPSVRMSPTGGEVLFLELPRAHLEKMLGPTRLYSTLTIGADLASTRLATCFIRELVALRDRLSADAGARMASIGVDLIVASIAERLAQEVPRPLHGTVVVQRAKAYVEAHLGDTTLDPPQLAAAVGVSLRRLQELFHERGQHISDWIWQRRLETAAKRLADPGCAHLAIGTLAYGCGFASQAHFARRFKTRYGMAPSEHRHAALMSPR